MQTATTTKRKITKPAANGSPLDHEPASEVEAYLMRAAVNAQAFFRGAKSRVRVSKLPLMTARNATAKPAPVFDAARVRRLREKRLRLSQTVFAALMNASPQTVQSWEQGTKKPNGPTARLLEVAELYPDLFVQRMLER